MIVSTVALLVLTGIAAWTDATRHTIYNWTTYPGILLGIALKGWESGWPGAEDGLAVGSLVHAMPLSVRARHPSHSPIARIRRAEAGVSTSPAA